MLLPNHIDHFRKNVVIIILVLAAFVPNVLTRIDQIVPNVFEQSKQNASQKVPYEEYHIEHNISQINAKKHFFEVGIKLIDGA